MSERQIQPWQQALSDSRRKFEAIVEDLGVKMPYDREAMFAMQAIQGNDHLMKIANSNPQSLRNAVINIAAIGLSLNPATAYAYLVPRDGKACLDISYKGMVKLATDTGAVKWAQAELVYENDKFEYHGPTQAPTHSTNPFAAERGDLVGVYCVAKTADGDILVEVMRKDEIDLIMNTSKAKNGPAWKQWYGEMARKSVIKRASKRWPYSQGHERMARAVDVLNEHEGLSDKHVIDYTGQVSPEKKAEFGKLVINGDGSALYLWSDTEKAEFVEVHRAYIGTVQRGQKQAAREHIGALLKEGESRLSGYLDEVIAAMEGNDDARHLWVEMTEAEADWIADQLPNELQSLAREGREAAKEAA